MSQNESQTWKVTITTVIPSTDTDPSTWDFKALIKEIRAHHWAEVDAVQLEPVSKPDTSAIYDAAATQGDAWHRPS